MANKYLINANNKLLVLDNKLLLLNETYGRKYGYIAPDPIVHLDFDPQYIDIVNDSGTDYVTKAYNIGTMGSAMDFSNTGAYSIVPYKDLMPNGTNSINMGTGYYPARRLFSGNLVGFMNGNHTIFFVVNFSNLSGHGSHIHYLLHSTSFKLYEYNNNKIHSNYGSRIVFTPESLTLGTYVISFTREILGDGINETRNIYINGSIIVSNTSVLFGSGDTGAITLGAYTYYSWLGSIAKVLIYNKLLTNSEHDKTVQTLYNKYITI